MRLVAQQPTGRQRDGRGYRPRDCGASHVGKRKSVNLFHGIQYTSYFRRGNPGAATAIRAWNGIALASPVLISLFRHRHFAADRSVTVDVTVTPLG